MGFSSLFRKPRVHLDYASATPVSERVFDAMRPYFRDVWANPSAVYEEGVIARAAIERARTDLARTLHVRPAGITWTSGGTEANNLAIVGTIEARRKDGMAYEEMEVLSMRIEHPSILETLTRLKERGVRVTYLPVDGDGLVSVDDVSRALSKRVVLVTYAYVNSEIGVIQDVKGISRAVRKWNDANEGTILTHVDASQAPLWLPCALDSLGVDMMTLDAGKCYGPKGVGALVRRAHVALEPVLFGGGQESGLRSGTENAALIIGAARAFQDAQSEHEALAKRVATLRDGAFDRILKEFPDAVVNGSKESRVANNVNVSFPGTDVEYAVIWLDAKGIATSTRSACGAAGKNGSDVVREMTKDEARALSTIRFTFGRESTMSDISRAIHALKAYNSVMYGKDGVRGRGKS
ncbi:MAG TPA: cysteine desulfurase family protein [Candidatus Paceibacterota bacterium]|nr:cysteine desulfurase family protein [Candidatus Paceibacterota bacterium]